MENLSIYTLAINAHPRQEDISKIQAGLDAHNAAVFVKIPNEFCIHLLDQHDTIFGRISALTYSDSLHIILL